jgi:hypothetical protein
VSSRCGIARDQRTLDANTADLYPVCPRCDNVCPTGSTVCECGARLTLQPVPAIEVPRRLPYGCSCDGAGVCQACIFDSYEGALA